MELNSISIEQFKQRGLKAITCYQNDLVITNDIEDLEPFREPCRMDATTILVCLNGEIDCSINLKRYHVKANDILVNFTGDIIQLHNARNVEAYAVLLSTSYLNELQIDFKQRSNFYLHIRENAVTSVPLDHILQLKPYYSLLKNNMESLQTEAIEILKGLTRAFSYTIISLIHSYQKGKDEHQAISNDLQLFDKFMALLTLHHSRERSVKFYADCLCLTPNYLSYAIKLYSGKTASQWINEYVILEAKILLKNTDIRVKEIAYRLNFISQSAFGKYFKQQTGIGPKEYRQSE